MAEKIRVAIVKFGGLSIGGSELRLQLIALHLPKDLVAVDYYYCDAAPYVGSDYKHGDTDPERLRYLQDSGVNLVKFKVQAKDVTKPTHDWVNTDFWQVFDPKKYDLVQTVKAGHKEYPFYLIPLPIVEIVGLAWGGVDRSPNIAWSVQPSPWQWGQWYKRGGRLERVSVIPNPALPPKTSENYRGELGIAEDHVVAGLIQRDDNNVFSPIPLAAFERIQAPDRHFVVMNGGSNYREQAQRLGLKNFHHIPKSGSDQTVSRFFNTLDFFAHGRRDGETYGTVFAEAMIHGLPCLSHFVDGAGNAQQETMGPCGLFARDLEEYTEDMERLFSDGCFRGQLAAKARHHASEHFDLGKGIDQLLAVYRKVLKLPEQTQKLTIPYGLSPLGFQYAGPIGAPGTLASHVITGDIPSKPYVELMRFFLPHVRSFVDLGTDSGLYGFLAAHEGRTDLRVTMARTDSELCAQVQKTVWLNNWESRVHVVDWRTKRMDELQLAKMDLVFLDQPISENFRQDVAALLDRDKPVLLLVNQQSSKVRWLSSAGYRVLRCTAGGFLRNASSNAAKGGMYVALHVATHGAWIPSLFQLAQTNRRRSRGESTRDIVDRSLTALRHPLQTLGGIRHRLSRLSASRRASNAK